MKVKVKTKLVANQATVRHEVSGILSKNVLQYRENGTKVFLNFSDRTMIRRDDDKKISYKFIENEETLNELLLQHENITIDIPVLTRRFSILENCCEINYLLVFDQQAVDYQVRWEEVK